MPSHAGFCFLGRGEARAADGTRRLADPGDWVRREVETGLATPRCAVVPVLLDGAKMPPAEALPESLVALTHRNAFALSAANWDAAPSPAGTRTP